MNIIQQLEAEQAAKIAEKRSFPEFEPGDTVRVQVRVTETLTLSRLLSKSLDDSNPGNGVGKHVGHLRPDSTGFFESGSQTVPNPMNQPGDERQGYKRDQRKRGVD